MPIRVSVLSERPVMPRCVVIIPARYASSRFPGKPLVPIAGRPMIQHVYARARQARLVDTVIVATDDQRIVEAVQAGGGQAVLTSPSHATGTDRIAEVAAQLPCDIVVNVQGDEPGVAPEAIDAMVQPMLADPAIRMATLARPLRDVAELLTPNVNKVVVDRNGYALYFSRAPIPYDRHAWPQAPHLLAAAGTDRATGAIARPGTRLPYPGGADHLREHWGRYPGGCGSRRATAHVRGTLE